jgi:hypothetical protein
MTHLLRFFAGLVAWLRRSPAEREAEIVYLRQQLVVLKRTAPARPRLKATDRLIIVCLYCLFPSLLDASIIFKPETLLRWYRTGFRLFWRWKSRRPPGRPALSPISEALFGALVERTLSGVHRASMANCLSSVSRSLSPPLPSTVRRRGPPSQGWKTFLRNHTAHIAAIDMFVVPTIGFRLLYGLVIIRLERRHLVWINVTANPTADWIARQITRPSSGIRHRSTSFGTEMLRMAMW